MAKYWDPPHFHPKFFLTKMTQNGLKWILNTTLKNVKFCRREPGSKAGRPFIMCSESRIYIYVYFKRILRKVVLLN